MPQVLTDPKIEIFLKSKRLRLFSGNQLVKEYPIAIGKPNTPTPPGDYEIRTKVMYPGGVFGTRWMEFKPRYGIHGTNNPASIGTMASLGCVRMFNHDVDELFGKVRVGTPVKVMNATLGESIVPSNNPTSPGTTSPPYHSPNNSSQPNNPGTSDELIYTVQPGDTLWRIAQRFNVSINQILAINNIPNPNRLHVGQVIRLP